MYLLNYDKITLYKQFTYFKPVCVGSGYGYNNNVVVVMVECWCTHRDDTKSEVLFFFFRFLYNSSEVLPLRPSDVGVGLTGSI